MKFGVGKEIGVIYLRKNSTKSKMNYFSFSNRQLHCFKAHDHPIKCLAIDPNEEFFVTGSVDGDIKVKINVINIVDFFVKLKYWL